MISVAVITHNEEAVIARCLASARWADEILVVDAESSDRTAEIARAAGARVISRPWPGFGAQRAAALDACAGQWVFMLDADEVIPDDLAREIRRAVSADAPAAAMSVPRRFYFCGRRLRWGGCWPDRQVRLLLRSAARYDDALLHERPAVSGPVGALTAALDHYSYRSLDDYFERFRRYAGLDAARRAAAGQRYRWHHPLRLPLGFVWRYVFRAGFLDGYYGFLWALFGSFYDFVKFAYLREIKR